MPPATGCNVCEAFIGFDSNVFVTAATSCTNGGTVVPSSDLFGCGSCVLENGLARFLQFISESGCEVSAFNQFVASGADLNALENVSDCEMGDLYDGPLGDALCQKF